jgi:hypothetical protein
MPVRRRKYGNDKIDRLQCDIRNCSMGADYLGM